jgi:hypothetical protein
MTAFMRGRQGNLLLYLDRAFHEKVNTKKSQCPISNCATRPVAASDHYQRFVDNIFWNWNFDQFPFAAEPNPRTEGISLSIGESRSDARFETSFGSGPSRHTALPHELGRYRRRSHPSHDAAGFIGTVPGRQRVHLPIYELVVDVVLSQDAGLAAAGFLAEHGGDEVERQSELGHFRGGGSAQVVGTEFCDWDSLSPRDDRVPHQARV